MRTEITSESLERLAIGASITDDTITGFLARRLESGRITFALKYAAPTSGRQRWLTLGNDLHITAVEARRRAKAERAKIEEGGDPQRQRELEKAAPRSTTVNTMLDLYLDRRVNAERMKSSKEITRCFAKYVRPTLGKVPVRELMRGEVIALLDTISDNHGPVMADRVLSYFRKACHWYAIRDEKFTVPIIKGMTHSSPRARARDRILSDEEISAFWWLAEPYEENYFNVVLRLLLLTGQRRSEVAKMKWSDIKGGLWTIPAEDSKNGRSHEVHLTCTALEQLVGIPKKGPYIFGRGGLSPFSGFSKSKERFADHLGCVLKTDVSRWTLHDLRRTACSLMARAGVRSEVSEKVLNHVVGGVRGIYDRHGYAEEKKLALEALEKQILAIVYP